MAPLPDDDAEAEEAADPPPTSDSPSVSEVVASRPGADVPGPGPSGTAEVTEEPEAIEAIEASLQAAGPEKSADAGAAHPEAYAHNALVDEEVSAEADAGADAEGEAAAETTPETAKEGEAAKAAYQRAFEELKAAVQAAAAKPAIPRPENEALVALCMCVGSLAKENTVFEEVGKILKDERGIGEKYFVELMGVRRAFKRPVPATEEHKPKHNGRVKSYNTKKGFGFIDSKCCPRDIFVYNSHLIGRIGLMAGEMVEFDLVYDGDRPQARHVKVVASAPAPRPVVPSEAAISAMKQMSTENPLNAMKQAMALPTSGNGNNNNNSSVREMTLAMAAAAAEVPTMLPRRPGGNGAAGESEELAAKIREAQFVASDKRSTGARDLDWLRDEKDLQFTDTGHIPKGCTVRIHNYPMDDVNDCLGVVQGFNAARKKYSVTVDMKSNNMGSRALQGLKTLQLAEMYLKVEHLPPDGRRRPPNSDHGGKGAGAGNEVTFAPPLSGNSQSTALRKSASEALRRFNMAMPQQQPPMPMGAVPVTMVPPGGKGGDMGNPFMQQQQRQQGAPANGGCNYGCGGCGGSMAPRPTGGLDGPPQACQQQHGGHVQDRGLPPMQGRGRESDEDRAYQSPAGGLPPMQDRGKEGDEASARPVLGLDQSIPPGPNARPQRQGPPSNWPGSQHPGSMGQQSQAQQPPQVQQQAPSQAAQSVGSTQMPWSRPQAGGAGPASALSGDDGASRKGVTSHPPEGCKGQHWKVRESTEFADVIVRASPEVTGTEMRRIRPNEVVVQKGDTVVLPSLVVRMPIEPEGWVTVHARRLAEAWRSVVHPPIHVIPLSWDSGHDRQTSRQHSGGQTDWHDSFDQWCMLLIGPAIFAKSFVGSGVKHPAPSPLLVVTCCLARDWRLSQTMFDFDDLPEEGPSSPVKSPSAVGTSAMPCILDSKSLLCSGLISNRNAQAGGYPSEDNKLDSCTPISSQSTRCTSFAALSTPKSSSASGEFGRGHSCPNMAGSTTSVYTSDLGDAEHLTLAPSSVSAAESSETSEPIKRTQSEAGDDSVKRLTSKRSVASCSERSCSRTSQATSSSSLSNDSDSDSEKNTTMHFPEGFVFGAATCAYQIEGAAAEGGRLPSIWDDFCRKSAATTNNATGDVACDHYHRFRDDVTIMAALGLHSYRFSISWSRLIPEGEGRVNDEGARFYSDLIDALLEKGIEPWVTLYHWDMPSSLETKFGGWLGPKRRIVKAFGNFAQACFRLFGDRVKRWMTINEPYCVAVMGYGIGLHAPGHTQNPATEPYIVGHNLLLAHAEAVRIYRTQFAEKQGGSIGIVLNVNYKMAFDSSSDLDVRAAQRSLDFELGWFADPIFRGDYPKRMRDTCGDRLPNFTDAERKLLLGSSDFLGLNYYFATFCSAPAQRQNEEGDAEDRALAAATKRGRRASGGLFAGTTCFADAGVRLRKDPSWEQTDMGWYLTPWGLRELLVYAHQNYAPPGGLYVTENGCAHEPALSKLLDDEPGALVPRPHDTTKAPEEDFANETFQDPERVRFLRQHLTMVHGALAQNADVRGYFVWSLLDNFEWSEGYNSRFGIVRVDYPTQKRTIKESGRLFSGVARAGAMAPPRASDMYRTSIRRSDIAGYSAPRHNQ